MIGGGNLITSDKFLLNSLVGLFYSHLNLVRVNAVALIQFYLVYHLQLYLFFNSFLKTTLFLNLVLKLLVFCFYFT